MRSTLGRKPRNQPRLWLSLTPSTNCVSATYSPHFAFFSQSTRGSLESVSQIALPYQVSTRKRLHVHAPSPISRARAIVYSRPLRRIRSSRRQGGACYYITARWSPRLAFNQRGVGPQRLYSPILRSQKVPTWTARARGGDCGAASGRSRSRRRAAAVSTPSPRDSAPSRRHPSATDASSRLDRTSARCRRLRPRVGARGRLSRPAASRA